MARKQQSICKLPCAKVARKVVRRTTKRSCTEKVWTQRSLYSTRQAAAAARRRKTYSDWPEIRAYVARLHEERVYHQLVCECYEKYLKHRWRKVILYSTLRPRSIHGYMQIRRAMLRTQLDIRTVDTKSVVDLIHQIVVLEECHILLIKRLLRVKIKEWEAYLDREHLIPPNEAVCVRACQLYDLMHKPWYFAPGYTTLEYDALMDDLGVSAYYNKFTYDYLMLYELKRLYHALISYVYVGWFSVGTAPSMNAHDVVLRSAQNFKKGRAKMRGSWSTRRILVGAYIQREHIRRISQNIPIGAAYLFRKSIVANLKELYDW